MRILISNDDGIESEGLRALAAECAKEHEVYIAAPWHEQSGMAHRGHADGQRQTVP